MKFTCHAHATDTNIEAPQDGKACVPAFFRPSFVNRERYQTAVTAQEPPIASDTRHTQHPERDCLIERFDRL